MPKQEGKHMKKNKIIADEKVLHCISRMLQEGITGNTVKCLYCKYAPECRDEFERTRDILFIEILEELRMRTGVEIGLEPGTMHKKILCGSWLENYPKLLEEFTNMSFDEQQDNLQHPDILKHLHNPTV